MESRIAFDVAEIVSLVGVSIMTLLYFLLKRFVMEWDKRLNIIEKDMQIIKSDMPIRYVVKDDYKDDMQEIKTDLKQIRNFLMEGR